jgi:RNA polymerase sigma-B factor
MTQVAHRELPRERLITNHLPLAHRLARQHWTRREPIEDLEQVAAVGLVKAVDGFDPDRAVPFIAYAIPKIRGELWRYLRDCTGSVRVPRPLQELQSRIRQARGDQNDAHEIAALVGADESAVRDALSADDLRFPYSLEQPAGTDGRPLQEFVGSPDPDMTAIENRQTVTALLALLSERERRVVVLTVMSDLSQRQVAALVGVSQMHVSRLRAAGIGRLRQLSGLAWETT